MRQVIRTTGQCTIFWSAPHCLEARRPIVEQNNRELSTLIANSCQCDHGHIHLRHPIGTVWRFFIERTADVCASRQMSKGAPIDCARFIALQFQALAAKSEPRILSGVRKQTRASCVIKHRRHLQTDARNSGSEEESLMSAALKGNRTPRLRGRTNAVTWAALRKVGVHFMRTKSHKILLKHLCFLLFLLLAFSAAAASGQDSKYFVFVGTYTGQGSEGIYSYHFDPDSGQVTAIGLAATTSNPSFLAVEPNGRFLYAVNEQDTLNGKPNGGVSAFAVDRQTGKLNFLNQVSSLGTAPAHVSLDKTGRYVLVANYNSGNVAVFPVGEYGKLGAHTAFEQQTGFSINKARQAGPHAHFIGTDNDNRFALSADLGTDSIYVYRFDPEKGTLTANAPPTANVKAGSGPRHIAFSPSGKFAYLTSEMGGTVTVFAYDQQAGVLTTKQIVSSLPENFTGDNREAEIVVDAKGKYLYVSNRGDTTDNIVAFRINGDDGTLSFIQRISSGGKIPRNFAIDPTGRWLFAANHRSNNIQLFRIDAETGRLTPASQITGIFDPVCVIFAPER